MTVERIPTECTMVYRFDQIETGTFEVGVNCPYCYYDNRFNFVENK